MASAVLNFCTFAHIGTNEHNMNMGRQFGRFRSSSWKTPYIEGKCRQQVHGTVADFQIQDEATLIFHLVRHHTPCKTKRPGANTEPFPSWET